MNNLDLVIDDIKNDWLMKKYMETYTWLSGCQTYVSTIIIEHEPKRITIQLNTDRNYFDKFIKRKVDKWSSILESGMFYKSDGTCPCELIFWYR